MESNETRSNVDAGITRNGIDNGVLCKQHIGTRDQVRFFHGWEPIVVIVSIYPAMHVECLSTYGVSSINVANYLSPLSK